MSLQLWSDNETDQDLLGFRVHADLIRSVVTDRHILPIVLGVFGDWGCGKSSIMRMLQQDLGGAGYESTVCLYFNGWMFEGYEDAKSALLSTILVQIGENKKFGPAAKQKVVRLLKRVKWMEVAKLGVKHVGVPLVAALLTGGVGGVVSAVGGVAAAATKPMTGGAGENGGSEAGDQRDGGEQWADLVEADPGKPDVLEVRKFRDEFADMLAQTNIESLVILIDDLDRCLPERIIETLEAIKLFVAVPRTAFVIGADPRIVRHAIATRYVKYQIGNDVVGTADEQYDLVKDYLEKLIQVPYHLPRLSPSEVESYINLLACQHALPPQQSSQVLEHWHMCRKKNLYAAYNQTAICEALGSVEAVPKDLLAQLAWSNAIADVVTDGLKGNPRQVKRMLNAMALRKQLATVAQIQIRDDVLAKLMVLEYANPPLFQELGQWQAVENGFPDNISVLERAAIDGTSEKSGCPDGASKEWLRATVQHWLRMQPGLSEIDLRDYFWLARDRTHSTLSGVTMVAPIVRRLFDSLTSTNKGEQKLATKGVADLTETERSELLSMLRRQIERHPDQVEALDALMALVEAGAAGAGATLIAGLKNCVPGELQPGVAYRLRTLSTISGAHQADAKALLEQWAADQSTKIGRAAAKQLK